MGKSKSHREERTLFHHNPLFVVGDVLNDDFDNDNTNNSKDDGHNPSIRSSSLMSRSRRRCRSKNRKSSTSNFKHENLEGHNEENNNNINNNNNNNNNSRRAGRKTNSKTMSSALTTDADNDVDVDVDAGYGSDGILLVKRKKKNKKSQKKKNDQDAQSTVEGKINKGMGTPKNTSIRKGSRSLAPILSSPTENETRGRSRSRSRSRLRNKNKPSKLTDDDGLTEAANRSLARLSQVGNSSPEQKSRLQSPVQLQTQTSAKHRHRSKSPMLRKITDLFASSSKRSVADSHTSDSNGTISTAPTDPPSTSKKNTTSKIVNRATRPANTTSLTKPTTSSLLIHPSKLFSNRNSPRSTHSRQSKNRLITESSDKNMTPKSGPKTKSSIFLKGQTPKSAGPVMMTAQSSSRKAQRLSGFAIPGPPPLTPSLSSSISSSSPQVSGNGNGTKKGIKKKDKNKNVGNAPSSLLDMNDDDIRDEQDEHNTIKYWKEMFEQEAKRSKKLTKKVKSLQNSKNNDVGLNTKAKKNESEEILAAYEKDDHSNHQKAMMDRLQAQLDESQRKLQHQEDLHKQLMHSLAIQTQQIQDLETNLQRVYNETVPLLRQENEELEQTKRELLLQHEADRKEFEERLQKKDAAIEYFTGELKSCKQQQQQQQSYHNPAGYFSQTASVSKDNTDIASIQSHESSSIFQQAVGSILNSPKPWARKEKGVVM